MCVINKLFLFKEIAGNDNLGEPWGQCPVTMIKGHKLYIATVALGRARNLQIPGSHVSLEIPDGYKGVYVMGVHTDHSDKEYFLSQEECIVSPAVEVLYRGLMNDIDEKRLDMLTINIPHCVRDESALKLIRVKRRDVSRGIPFHDIEYADDPEADKDSYSVNSNFVRIKTKKFSEFIYTTCKITCQAAIRIFLFAGLNTWRRNNNTTVKIKSFLCSSLFRTADYRNVRILMSVTNITLIL